jgi:ubiquinone/menaquinone biosynthesis C-methylase UbiE
MNQTDADHDQYSYEPFTHHAFYTAVNAALVERAVGYLCSRQTSATPTLVDLGCGTGAITQLVVEALARHGCAATMLGIDPSAQALRLAKQRCAGSGSAVRFLHGDAATLAQVGQPVDALFFCNAMHLVPDPRAVLAQIAAALTPGGLLACNSAFFAGAYVPGTERFYQLFLRGVIGWLRREYPEVRLSREEPARAKQWLAQETYEALLREQGFRILFSEREEVQMTLESWQDICRYWLFIEGVLPGVPLAVGSAALVHSATQVFADLALTTVPRYWLQLVAQRAPGAAGG